MSNRKEYLGGLQRMVVKVGSQVLTRGVGLDAEMLDRLCEQLSAVRARGIEVALVTSGAVATGRFLLGIRERPRTIPLKQASAAAGQAMLMRQYAERMERHGIHVAQLLLTAEDLRSRKRFLNARNTLTTLFELGVLPIINENDTVAVDEIKFGDNDRLSSLVTNLVEASLLVILTDIDGFYDSDPRQNPAARRHEFLERLTPEHLGQASSTRSNVGLGGMITKLEAARQAALSGASTVLALGTEPNVLPRILDGEPLGTFIAAAAPIGRRKHWIAYTVEMGGELRLDPGATQAILYKGRSLLPSGIREVRGDFETGDGVRILDPEGQELGRGLVGYSSEELRRIIGRQSSEIEGILGYKYLDEVVHRDNLALFRNLEP